MIVLYLAAVALVLSNVSAGELRRDDKWPPPHILDALAALRKICQPETGVTDKAISDFSDGDLHDDANLKCYMHCIFREAQLIDQDGNVHLEKIHTHIDKLDAEIKEIAKNMVSNCPHPAGDNDCEKAFNLNKCWKTTDPKHYFIA